MPQEDSLRYSTLHDSLHTASILTLHHREKMRKLTLLERLIEKEWLMGRVAGGEDKSIVQTDHGNRTLTEQSLMVA